MPEEEGVQRERDLERLLTFVDAIVAIAITLLVLPLVDIAGGAGHGKSVTSLLQESTAQLGAFFLSFAVIANLWLGQHHVLRHLVAADHLLVRLLLLWTLTIVFLPFPTALISGHDVSDQAATKILYLGTMAISTLLLTLITVIVARDRSLRDSDEAPDYRPYLLELVAFALALALMLLFPQLSYWPLLLLLVRRAPVRHGSA